MKPAEFFGWFLIACALWVAIVQYEPAGIRWFFAAPVLGGIGLVFIRKGRRAEEIDDAISAADDVSIGGGADD